MRVRQSSGAGDRPFACTLRRELERAAEPQARLTVVRWEASLIHDAAAVLAALHAVATKPLVVVALVPSARARREDRGRVVQSCAQSKRRQRAPYLRSPCPADGPPSPSRGHTSPGTSGTPCVLAESRTGSRPRVVAVPEPEEATVACHAEAQHRRNDLPCNTSYLLDAVRAEAGRGGRDSHAVLAEDWPWQVGELVQRLRIPENAIGLGTATLFHRCRMGLAPVTAGLQCRSETAHGMWSNNRPAGISSASAKSTIVGKRGARIPRSTFEIAVVCRPVARDRSSWDQPRSARTALRLAAKRSSGLTVDSFRVLAQEAKRHIVNLESQSTRRTMRDLRSGARSMLDRRVPWLACRIDGCGSTLENCDGKSGFWRNSGSCHRG